MNQVKVIVIPDDGDIFSAKRVIKKAISGKDYIIDYQGDDTDGSMKFGWNAIEHGRFDFDIDTQHDKEYRLLLRTKMFLKTHKKATNGDIERVIVNSPIGDITQKVNDFKLREMPDWFSVTGDSYTKTFFYGGQYNFGPRTNPTQYKQNGVAKGYQINGTAWNAISWYAVQRFSSDNPGFTIKFKMDYSFTNSTMHIEDNSFMFLRSDPEIWKRLTNGEFFVYKGIPVHENQVASQAPVLKIECTVNAGIFLDKKAVITTESSNPFSSRGISRHPENPWNALPEHVRYDTDGTPELNQPNGAGPNRDENYSEATRDGASTRPLEEIEQSEQPASRSESSSRDEEFVRTMGGSESLSELPEINSMAVGDTEYSNTLTGIARSIRERMMRDYWTR